MFSTGDLDTRVPPSAAFKMAARLQASTTSGFPVILGIIIRLATLLAEGCHLAGELLIQL
jgi:hypothetical protein